MFVYLFVPSQQGLPPTSGVSVVSVTSHLHICFMSLLTYMSHCKTLIMYCTVHKFDIPSSVFRSRSTNFNVSNARDDAIFRHVWCVGLYEREKKIIVFGTETTYTRTSSVPMLSVCYDRVSCAAGDPLQVLVSFLPLFERPFF